MKRIVILTLGLGALATWAVLALPSKPVSSKPNYVLHEWGTFTSVFGSDGRMLTGLEREEEALPAFVHAHEGMENNLDMRQAIAKGWVRPVHNVTVKMETPVIYFYTDEPFQAKVDVGFHGGSISQWYPQRSSGEVPPPYKDTKQGRVGGEIDFSKGYTGAISWEVDVLERSAENESQAFVGLETPTWLYPRMTDANVVKSKLGEHEKYLFYRGLGNFEQPIVPVFTSENQVRIENTGESTIPYALIFDWNADGVLMKEVNAIPGGDSAEVTLEGDRLADAPSYLSNLFKTSERPQDWRPTVYRTMVRALVKQGLYQREADSMVRTWWKSYFEHRGCRIFWIVPNDFVEKTLPLNVSPAPAETVRVLVGRSELLKPEFERRLLSAGEKFHEKFGHDRHFLSYAARVNQLTAEEQKVSHVIR